MCAFRRLATIFSSIFGRKHTFDDYNINDCAMIYANRFMITTNRMRPSMYHWLMQDKEGESLEA